MRKELEVHKRYFIQKDDREDVSALLDMCSVLITRFDMILLSHISTNTQPTYKIDLFEGKSNSVRLYKTL